MHRIIVSKIGLATSKLGFGCSALGGRVSARRGKRALACAWEHGVRHFDTAPPYGWGCSERLLGEFIAGVDRGALTIATKCGIEPPGHGTLARMLRRAAAPIAGASETLRRRLSKAAAGSLMKPVPLEPDLVRRSLSRSLRDLGVDRIDLMLLHFWSEGTDLRPALDVLREAQRAGRITTIGLAVPAEAALRLRAEYGDVFPLAQTACNLEPVLRDRITQGFAARLGHSPLGGLVGKLVASFAAASDESKRSLRDAFGLDRVTAGVLITLQLRHALTREDLDLVVMAMYDPSHIATNAQLADAHPLNDAQRAALARFSS